jgi:thioredoxin-related protein
MRLLLLLLFAATAWLSVPAAAAELLMVRQAGCPWCRWWDRDVGPVYDKTDLGKRAPLRMIDIGQQRELPWLKARVVYTPTFVLVEQDREIGRIEGYPGEDFFWARLDQLLRQLPPPTGERRP